MRLYHGTNHKSFDKILLSKSKDNKDFGKGFYLTDDKQQALELANYRTSLLGGEPLVLAYEFSLQDALDAGLLYLDFKDYTEEWANFIFLNRDTAHKEKMHLYDIVHGPIADDKVGLQIQFFKQQFISIETLIERLKYQKPTFQYYFGTERALEFLKRI